MMKSARDKALRHAGTSNKGIKEQTAGYNGISLARNKTSKYARVASVLVLVIVQAVEPSGETVSTTQTTICDN